MGDELSMKVRRERGVVIAEVSGDIDVSTVSGLRERMLELANSGQPLIADLNDVSFIDSAGLGVLIGTARRALERGGSLHAVCSKEATRKLLWLTGVDRRIPLTSTVDEALTLLTVSGDDPA